MSRAAATGTNRRFIGETPLDSLLSGRILRVLAVPPAESGAHRPGRKRKRCPTKNTAASAARSASALSYPDTQEDFPWGESAFKVKGKTFVFMNDGKDAVSFSTKLGDARELALALPGSQPTHYAASARRAGSPCARPPRPPG